MKKYYYKGTNGDTYGPVTKKFLWDSPYVYPTTMISSVDDKTTWFPYQDIMDEVVSEDTDEIQHSQNFNEKSFSRYQLGIVGLVISVIIGIIGFMMDTTNGDVYNIGMMHQQSIVLIIGGFLFIGSLITMFLGNSND